MKHTITTRALVIGLLWLMLVAAAFGQEPGRMVDIGGRSLHVVGTDGRGPVILFEAGGGAFSSSWLKVQTAVARELRVPTISYDRAGLGWSDAGTLPYRISDKADDLDALLRALAVDTPIVLVGHSYGGWVAQAFASRYPERIGALVLVDPNSSHFFAQYPKKVAKIEADGRKLPPRGFKRLGLRLQRNWFARQTGAPRSAFEPVLSDRHQNTLGHMLGAFGETRQRLENVRFPDVPTIMISRGLPQKGFPWGDAASEAAWRDGHAKLIEHLSDAEHWIADRGTHAVVVDQPEIVVAAIRQILHVTAETSSNSL